MTQYIKHNKNLLDYLDFIGDKNPQFIREIKGRLKTKNVVATIILAIVTQFILIICFLGKLPDASYQVIENPLEKIYSATEQYSRYCAGGIENKDNLYSYSAVLCRQDMYEHWIIDWQLFWFDIFVTLSVMGIFLLLVLGTSILVSNAIAEKKQETLNLIRLSPQSASQIFLGKILGVPILLYLFVALALPLHTIAALQAHIPLNLIITFDLAIIASCGFFYSLSLLISFLISQPIITWITAISLAIFLIFSTVLNTYKSSFHTETIIDWLFIFNPNNLILYVGKVTAIASHHFDYVDFFSIFGNSSYNAQEIEPIFMSNVLFYGQSLWAKVGVGIGIVIANYCLWTYWIWQGLKRRFYNPENTVISKQQSYWITGYFTAIAVGFSLQDINHDLLFGNIIFLQFLFLIWCLALTFLLSPHHQTLQDWARYRHHTNKHSKVLWRELVFSEKSPSTIAIAINFLMTALYIIPTLIVFPLQEQKTNIFLGLIISIGTLLLCASLVQWTLMSKSKYKKIFAIGNVISITILPSVIYSIIKLCNVPEPFRSTTAIPLEWLLTSFPVIAIENTPLSIIALIVLGQWLATTVISLQIIKKLRQVGRSESYKVLNNS